MGEHKLHTLVVMYTYYFDGWYSRPTRLGRYQNVKLCWIILQ